MSSLVKVNLHGRLGEICNPNWELAVDSLSEAIRLIEMNTKKLYKTLLQFDKENIKFVVVLNGKNFYTDKPIDINNPKTILESELCIKNSKLKTVDIVPVLEGSDSKSLGIATTIIGIALIVVGIIALPVGIGAVLIGAGVTLLAAGVVTLLSKPPAFEDFREIEQGGKTSYLFSGPQNVVGEGGPVPLGYGELLVGSQVISASYVIRDFNVENTSEFLRDEYGNLHFFAPTKQQKPQTWYIYDREFNGRSFDN